jgi:hypothetical protein
MERKLIKETVGALVAKTIMIIPVTRLGADAACNLAAQCGINLDSNVRSDCQTQSYLRIGQRYLGLQPLKAEPGDSD